MLMWPLLVEVTHTPTHTLLFPVAKQPDKLGEFNFVFGQHVLLDSFETIVCRMLHLRLFYGFE